MEIVIKSKKKLSKLQSVLESSPLAKFSKGRDMVVVSARGKKFEDVRNITDCGIIHSVRISSESNLTQNAFSNFPNITFSGYTSGLMEFFISDSQDDRRVLYSPFDLEIEDDSPQADRKLALLYIVLGMYLNIGDGGRLFNLYAPIRNEVMNLLRLLRVEVAKKELDGKRREILGVISELQKQIVRETKNLENLDRLVIKTEKEPIPELEMGNVKGKIGIGFLSQIAPIGSVCRFSPSQARDIQHLAYFTIFYPDCSNFVMRLLPEVAVPLLPFRIAIRGSSVQLVSDYLQFTHPHISKSNSPCFGGYTPLISKGFLQKNYGLIVSTVLIWKDTYEKYNCYTTLHETLRKMRIETDIEEYDDILIGGNNNG